MEIVRLQESPEDELNKAIAYAITIIGFNPEKTDKTQILIIKDFLRSSFPNFKLEAFKEAFRLGAAGKFDISLKHYQSFSAVYISDVLNAYKRYEQKQNLLPEKKEVLALDYDKKEFSEHEKKQAYDFIVGVCEKSKKLPYIASWNLAYDYMESRKLIDLDNDEKEMFMENVIYSIKSEINQRKHDNRNYQGLKNTITQKALLKAECRRRMVINHFVNLGYEKSII